MFLIATLNCYLYKIKNVFGQYELFNIDSWNEDNLTKKSTSHKCHTTYQANIEKHKFKNKTPEITPR